MKNIIVIGGQFDNKGAQAMSFITISRLKQQYPEHNILFASPTDVNKKSSELAIYDFDIIDNPFKRKNFIGENLIRKILNKKNRIDPRKYKNLVDNTEYLFDISGYVLSSQLGEKASRRYLSVFEKASRRGIESIIMPQSIGPFDYSNSKMQNLIRNVLSKVTLIMPRESEGTKLLSELGVIDNVFQSPDLVLTNKKSIDWNLIYKQRPNSKSYDIPSNSVAVIPNMRNFEHGNKNEVLALYSKGISFLLEKGKYVYLVAHSKDDLQVCKLVYEAYSSNLRVRFIQDDLSPTEFEKLITQFDFAIASRFHSIVHSYKSGTPCLVLGWAVKYMELAKLFTQDQYVFDVTKALSLKTFVEAINKLDNNKEEEKEKIQTVLDDLNKKPDPFEIAFKELK